MTLPSTPSREEKFPELPRPSVTFADHSYPAFSKQQMFDFAKLVKRNSHSTLTTESARLAERVRVLEGELKKIRSVIPMDFLIAHDIPGATGPTDALDLVGAIRSLVHNARKWEERARSALSQKDGE